jgi:hypothetical protein
MRNRSFRGLVTLCLIALPAAGSAAALPAQSAAGLALNPQPAAPLPDSSPPVAPRPAAFRFAAPGDSARRPTVFRWYHAAAALSGIALVSLADKAVRDEAQEQRSSATDDAARLFRHMGQPEVFATVSLGTVAVGLVSGNDRITRAGGRITAGLLLSGFIAGGIKEVMGRRRPYQSHEQYSFHPFSGSDALPSGHTTAAFALASGVSDELHSTPATIGLFTLATLTGWSRINDNRHWLSDVLSGAAVGITSSKVMNGHWRVLGVGAPRFLLEPDGSAGVAWSMRF